MESNRVFGGFEKRTENVFFPFFVFVPLHDFARVNYNRIFTKFVSFSFLVFLFTILSLSLYGCFSFIIYNIFSFLSLPRFFFVLPFYPSPSFQLFPASLSLLKHFFLFDKRSSHASLPSHFLGRRRSRTSSRGSISHPFHCM